ncbi:MAG: hypothetical protein AB7F74_28895, partial [Parvibaculaceae bacterium]
PAISGWPMAVSSASPVLLRSFVALAPDAGHNESVFFFGQIIYQKVKNQNPSDFADGFGKAA